MECRAGGGKQAIIGDPANPVVRKLQPVADRVEHPTPHQLLDRFGGLALGDPGGASEEREREVPTDDGSRSDEMACPFPEPIEASRHEIPYRPGQRGAEPPRI